MEIATIEVTGVNARRVSGRTGRWEIPAGLIGGTIRLRYGQDWKDLQKTVVFDCCGLTKDVVDAGELVTIPAEVVERPERKLLVGVYGTGTDGSATPTIWLEGYVCAAADPSGDPTTDPTLPVWAQLEARIQALEDRKPLCAVIWDLDRVTGSNQAAQVPLGETFSVSLSAEEGYVLDTVTVLMGGEDITNAVVANGLIWIPAVTGNLVIRAKAAKNVVFVGYSAPAKNGGALDLFGGMTPAIGNWLYTDYIPAAPGQTFRYVGDTSTNGEYASVWGYDQNSNARVMLVGNGNHLSGTVFTVPEGIYGLRCCFLASEAHTLEVAEDQAGLAGEVSFQPGIVVTITGEESPKEGGGATGYLPVGKEDLVVVYNIALDKGGRMAFYDAGKVFLSGETIYVQGESLAKMVSSQAIPENAAYVRISANVLDFVRAAVMRDV